MKPLEEIVRPNIWALKPYSSARDEYKGHAAHVFLDANECPYNAPLNRYPDPLQAQLKEQLAATKGVPAENIFLGNGSDEAIDLVYRVFCRPGIDNVVAISPTYGMYQVCADINNVEYRTVPLDGKYQMQPDALLEACDENTRVMWICTPNNPTGNDISHEAIEQILTQFQGIVVVDEAYSDYSPLQPFRLRLGQFPNIIVLNTFSKAWSSAAIRLGMAFASTEIIGLMNKVKYPYNVNALTQQAALGVLHRKTEIDQWRTQVLTERRHVMAAFAELPVCEHVYPTSANFFLTKVKDACRIYDYLVQQGIIVRNRHRVELCADCLRITIGTPDENNALLAAMRKYKP